MWFDNDRKEEVYGEVSKDLIMTEKKKFMEKFQKNLPKQMTSDILSDDDSIVLVSPSPKWAIQYPDQPDLLPPDEYVLCSITMAASPLEFALVPKELKCKVEDIEKRLAEFDMNHTNSDDERLYHQDDPCYIIHEGWYRRGRVEMVGQDDVHVLMVDIGQTAYVHKKLVKPLPIELVQLPPSAFICAIKGVDSRELYLATGRRFLEVIQAHEFVAVRSCGRNRWNNRLLVHLFDSRLRKNLSEGFQKHKKFDRWI